MPEQELPKAAGTAPVSQAAGEQGATPSCEMEKGPIQEPNLQSGEQRELPPQRIPHWLQQAERLLRVIVRMYLGLLVCLAPWYPQAWDANPLFLHSPGLLQFISQGWVRGLVSGLGLLNLWIALRDAIQGARDAGEE
jgi:hypothetical protein